MKKLFLSILCVMLITGCSTTKNTEKEPASVPKQEETVKKDNEQKVDQQDKTVEKKEEKKDKQENKTSTKTVKKEEKKDEQKKTSSKKVTSTKKKTSTTKKTTTTKKKTSTTKKNTTTKKKKKTISKNPETAKILYYYCIQCGYHCKTKKEILEHLDKSDNCGQYGAQSEKFEWPEEWN